VNREQGFRPLWSVSCVIWRGTSPDGPSCRTWVLPCDINSTSYRAVSISLEVGIK
jgi:hypothetical protein